jgi:hypothetical protein
MIRNPRDRGRPAREDRKHDQRADLRPGIYLGPLGTRLHRVRLPGSSQEIVVPSMVGRATYPPGAKVALASYSGGSGYAIAGRPPAGDQGGAQFSPRVFPPAPAPQAAGYLVLLEDPAAGTTLTAALYNADGTWKEDLDQRAMPGSSAYANGAQVIRTDPQGAVSGYSVVVVPNYGEVTVWDIDAQAIHSLTPLDGFGLPAALWPLWHEGFIFWAELSHTGGSDTYTYTLHRANADLTGETTLGSVNGTVPLPDAQIYHASAFAGRAASDGYRARAQLVTTDNGFVDELVFFAWDGSGGSRTPGFGWAQTNNCTGIERPDVAGSSFVAIDPTDPPGAGSPLHSIDASNAAGPLWPATVPAYTGDGNPVGAIIALDALDDQALALVRVHSNAGGTLGVDDFLSFIAYHGDPAAEEPTALTIEPHPTMGANPGSVFFRS